MIEANTAVFLELFNFSKPRPAILIGPVHPSQKTRYVLTGAAARTLYSHVTRRVGVCTPDLVLPGGREKPTRLGVRSGAASLPREVWW